MPAYKPEEEAALRLIAMLRAEGFSDAEIFGSVAGGYGYLPYILDAAGIQSSYNLGRAGIAGQMIDREYDLVRNPYNVVAANQFYADQGGSPYLTDPTLANVPRGPASRYGGFIDSLLFPQGEAGAGAAGAPSTIAGSPGGIPGTGPTGAQSAAAVGLGGQLPGMSSPQFGGSLRAGALPGFSSFTSGDFARLTPDQRAQYFGQVQSTGRVSDAAAAYDDFARKYSHGGASAGGTYR